MSLCALMWLSERPNKTKLLLLVKPRAVKSYIGNILDLKSVWSCDRFALGPGNPFVCGDSPQHWCQQQTEGGDTENQQVHLSREGDIKHRG